MFLNEETGVCTANPPKLKRTRRIKVWEMDEREGKSDAKMGSAKVQNAPQCQTASLKVVNSQQSDSTFES